MTKFRIALWAASGLIFAASMPALAGPAKTPTVVELFTSQGCYSCPPAERFLGQLAAERDIVALEFHVDYWDELVYGAAGKWKDVFSRRAYTLRQRGYNRAIRRRNGVYTPQMVIGGRLEAVGSRERSVRSAIRAARNDSTPKLGVMVRPGKNRALTVTVDGGAASTATIWLVTFHRRATTRVGAGENKGKALTSHNVVTGVKRIGEWAGRSASVTLPRLELADGQGCAVLVQSGDLGPILGGAYCPDMSS